MLRAAAALGLGAAIVFAASGAAATHPEWTGHYVGNTFAGTYTNLTGSVVNGVSIGTADLQKNPVVAFTFGSYDCHAYAGAGSFYCYESLAVQPGQSVQFKGMSQLPLTSKGIEACDSHDVGATNNCVDVVLTSGSAPTAAQKKAAKAAYEDVQKAVGAENAALKSLNKGDLAGARLGIGTAISWLGEAYLSAPDAGSSAATIAISRAHVDDVEARDELDGKAGGRIARARTDLQLAGGAKKTALAKLDDIFD